MLTIFLESPSFSRSRHFPTIRHDTTVASLLTKTIGRLISVPLNPTVELYYCYTLITKRPLPLLPPPDLPFPNGWRSTWTRTLLKFRKKLLLYTARPTLKSLICNTFPSASTLRMMFSRQRSDHLDVFTKSILFQAAFEAFCRVVAVQIIPTVLTPTFDETLQKRFRAILNISCHLCNGCYKLLSKMRASATEILIPWTS
jgi:hypothetical protein